MPKKEEVKVSNISVNSKIGDMVNYKGGVGRIGDKTKNGFLVINQITKAPCEVKV